MSSPYESAIASFNDAVYELEHVQNEMQGPNHEVNAHVQEAIFHLERVTKEIKKREANIRKSEGEMHTRQLFLQNLQTYRDQFNTFHLSRTFNKELKEKAEENLKKIDAQISQSTTENKKDQENIKEWKTEIAALEDQWIAEQREVMQRLQLITNLGRYGDHRVSFTPAHMVLPVSFILPMTL